MPSPVEVALFPIPSLVAFPGTVVPLHVFEPRYRQMIDDCVREKRMIGVCHTRKTIREAKPNQTQSEAMNSNQATYLPQEVFSAGYCEVIETTADGRIMAEIHIEHRLKIVREIQSLPYRIVASESLEDIIEPDQLGETIEQRNQELQILINAKLLVMIGSENPEFGALINGAEWQSMSPEVFSFTLFQTLRFDPDLMQSILESRSTQERLNIVWDYIRQ
ncbi:MAG: Lon protease-like protein [Candidatus Azotimanducaceae bacterium]